MRALDIAVENNYIADIYIEDKDIMKRSIQNSKLPSKPKMKLEHSLYGLTFSVADWINQAGYDTSLGLAS